MHPEKEGKHLLARLIEVWGYYTDGWLFSCTWDGEIDSWRLSAAHRSPFPATLTPPNAKAVRVHAEVTRDEWERLHHQIVDDKAEQMYEQTFEPSHRLENLEDTDSMMVMARGC